MRNKRGAQAGPFPRGGLLLLVLVGVALLAAARLPGAAWATPSQAESPHTTVPWDEAIAGIVFEDLNRDGELDPGEPGIPDVVITLTGATEALTTTTDSGGGYSFLDLTVGETYTVTQTLPEGYFATTSTSVSLQLPAQGALVHFGNYRAYQLFLPLVSKNHAAQ